MQNVASHEAKQSKCYQATAYNKNMHHREKQIVVTIQLFFDNTSRNSLRHFNFQPQNKRRSKFN